jgi:hypothetical protein
MSKEKKESGSHDLGKDNSSAASRRDNHPAKQKERAKHAALRADQQISGFDTKSLGSDSFPKRSTKQ